MATLEQAKRIQALCDLGLARNGLKWGSKGPIEGHICVEQAVSGVMGEGFTNDRPSCVSGFVSHFKRVINDKAPYKDKASRGASLRRIAVAQLGSKGIDENAMVQALKQVVLVHCGCYCGGCLATNAVDTDKVPEAIAAVIAELRRQGVEGVALLDAIENEKAPE